MAMLQVGQFEGALPAAPRRQDIYTDASSSPPLLPPGLAMTASSRVSDIIPETRQ